MQVGPSAQNIEYGFALIEIMAVVISSPRDNMPKYRQAPGRGRRRRGSSISENVRASTGRALSAAGSEYLEAPPRPLDVDMPLGASWRPIP